MIERTRILFLCTANSARSIVAEAIANQMFGDHIIAHSAGSHPRSEPNPLALALLREHSLDTSKCSSKSWDVFRSEEFDVVVTLCDQAAAETCPVFPGAPAVVHWGLPDPPASDDPQQMFAHIFDALVVAFEAFIDAPPYDAPARVTIAQRALETYLREI
ncbi:MAG: arsenate reductase ArsC [Phycisphaerales bacterium]